MVVYTFQNGVSDTHQWEGRELRHVVYTFQNGVSDTPPPSHPTQTEYFGAHTFQNGVSNTYLST